MSSRIPTFGFKAPGESQSRLPVPQTTVKKPPPRTMLPSSVSRLASMRSAFKRPCDENIGSSVVKKRMTPISLLKSSAPANSAHTIPRFNNPMAPREFAMALKSDTLDSNLRTPISQKENNFIPPNNNIAPTSLSPIPPYSPIKKIITHEKEVNTEIEWSNFNRETEITHYRNQISSLQKSLSEAEFTAKEYKHERDLSKMQLEKLQSDFDRFKYDENQAKIEHVQQKAEREAAFQQQRSKLLEDNLKLQEKISQETQSKHDAQSKIYLLENEILVLRTQHDKVVEELKLKDSEILELKTKEDCNKAEEIELKNLKIQNEKLISQIEELVEKEKLSEIFSNEMKNMKTLEEENYVLKLKIESLQEVCDKAKLNEIELSLKDNEINSLKVQLEESEKMVKDLSYSQTQVNDWQTKLGSETPDDFKIQLDDLKQAKLILCSENEVLKNSNESLKDLVETNRENYEIVNNELQQAQIKIHEQDQALHENKNKEALLEKQIEILSERLEEVSTQKIELCEKLSTEIDKLNNDCKGYKTILNEREKEMFELKNEKSGLENLLKERNSMINDLNTQLHSIEAKLEDIKNQPKNDDNEEVRVVSLIKHNPYIASMEQRNKRYKELVEENARLTSLVEVLQSDETIANMTLQINDVLEKNSRIAKLEVEKEKCRKVIIKERKIHHELVNKLRSHFTDLTGYKFYMDRLYETVTLKHVLDERFRVHFKFLPDNLIKLVESSFFCTDKVDEYMRKYLQEGTPFYPAFLAAITLDLHSKRF